MRRAARPQPQRPAGPGPRTHDHARLVQSIDLRVSVVGTRGKATLAGLLAAALQRRGLAVHCNVPRRATDPQRLGAVARTAASLGLTVEDRALVEAERAAARAAWPVQALVLANHARGTAGQRALHAEVVRPHVVLLTNVRRDPAGLATRPLAVAARDLVRAITPGATVLSGEADPALKAVLRRECERAGLTFLDAAPAQAGLPAAEVLSLLQAFLVHRFGRACDAAEEAAIRQEMAARFRWAPSAIPGVRWFDAGPIHDPDSAQIVLNHLQAQRRYPVTFVAYFRQDRPGRTRAFVPFLEELLAAPDTRQVILAGHRAQAVADRLARWGSQVHVTPDDLTAIPRLMRRLQFDCQGGAIVTLCNGAPDWPRELARRLQRADQVAAPGLATPAAARASLLAAARPDVPRHVARPHVAPTPVGGVLATGGAPTAPLRPPRPVAARAGAAGAGAAASPPATPGPMAPSAAAAASPPARPATPAERLVAAPLPRPPIPGHEPGRATTP